MKYIKLIRNPINNIRSSRRKLALISLFLIIILLPLAIYITKSPPLTEASWFNDSWLYRKKVEITNAGSNQTDYQVSITLDTSTLITNGKLQSDCDDIRITDINGKTLPFWIEEAGIYTCNDTDTNIWTKVPSIPTSSATVYVYYGNPSATNREHGDDTFEFFDDFSSPSIDSSKWSQGVIDSTVGTDFSQSGGNLDGGNNDRYIQSTTSFTGDYIAETRVYTTSAATNGFSTIGFWASTTNNFGILDHSTTSYYRNDSGWTNFSYNGNGQWNRDQVKVEGTNATYWRTGETSGSSTNSTTNSGLSSEYVRLSSRYDSGIYDQDFDASWDWVFVRKSAATEPSVSSPGSEEITPGPIAYWRFDEGHGTTISDSSSSNLSGTMSSGITWQDESMCVSGKCLYFDGVNNTGVTISNTPVFSPSDDWSVSFWAKPDPSQILWQGVIYLKTNGSGWGIYASHNQSTTGFQAFLYTHATQAGGADDTFKSNAFTEDNNWIHYTITKEGTVYKWYINGAYDISEDKGANDVTLDTGTTWKIGFDYSNKYKGYIDEVKIYPYTRSADEVKADYQNNASAVLGIKDETYLSNGLVGYWKMDETSSPAADSSGNSNSGTWNGTADEAGGKFGNSITLDGDSDYVLVSDPASGVLDFGTNDFSLATWVKTSTTGVRQAILDKATGVGNGYDIEINANNRVTLWLSSGSLVGFDFNGSTITDGNWHHVLVSIDKSTDIAKLYIDGKSDGTDADISAIGNIDTTNSLKIGSDNETANYFNGEIDEVRIYNRPLNSYEIRSLYNWAPGPTIYYDFNEHTGTSTLNDKSGNGYTATLTSMAESDWGPGKYGSSLEFDGTTNQYSRVASGIPAQGQNITVEAWVYPTTISDAGVDRNNFVYSSYYMALGNHKFNVYTPGTSSQGWHTSTGSTSTNQWQHLTFTYDGTNMRMYINGVLDKTVSMTGSITSVSTLDIGRRPDSTSSPYLMQGKVDEFKVYNYARTPGQIIEDMNAGHPIPGSPIGSQTSYWKFDEGYGTTANDQQAYRNGTLTCAGATCSNPTWKNDGKIGKALYFDASGTDRSYVTASPINIGSTTGDKMTWTMWVKPDTTQSGGGWIMRNGTGYDENYGWTLGSHSGGYHRVGLQIYDTAFRGVSTTNYIVPNNQWSHLAIVYSQAEWFKVYVNGVFKEQTTVSYGPSVQATSSFNLGGHSGTTGQYLNGYLDEVKIYNDELTADQIKLDMNQGASQVFGYTSTDSSGNADFSSDREYCIPGDSTSCSAPEAEWKFDEKTGSSAQDTSGNSNTGTITAATWKPAGVCEQGACLNYDGSGDFVSLGAAKFDTLSNATIEGWFKYTGSFDTNRVIFSHYKDGNNRLPFFVSYPAGYGNKLVFENIVASSNRAIKTNNDISADTWYHFAFTCGTGGMTLFLDGVKQTETNATTDCLDDIAATTSNSVGQHSGSAYFQGLIDHVRVYDYVRTPAQIAWDYNRGAPVGHWRFDECQGNTVNDVSSNSNNGTITIGGTGTQNGIGTCTDGDTTNAWYNGRNGKRNASLNFDGTDDYIDIGNDSSIAGAIATTSVSAWVNVTAGESTWRAIVSPTTGSHFHFQIQNSNKAQIYFYGPAKEALSTTLFNSSNYNKWFHIVGIWDGTNAKIYINGKKEAQSTSGSGSVTAATSNLFIGQGNGSIRRFNGQIDNVKIFNYALTAQQVKSLYNENSSIRFGPSSGSP